MQKNGYLKTAHEAEAAGYGCRYGDYVADRDKPVVVEVPPHLRNAPTIFQRNAGAAAAKPQRYEHIEPVKQEEAPPESPKQLGLRPQLKPGTPIPPMPQPPSVKRETGRKAHMIPAPWLQNKRIAAGITQRQMAKLCAVSESTAGRWETTGTLPQELEQYVADLLDWYINYGGKKLRKNQYG